MRFGRWATAIGLGALAASALVVAPSLHAQDGRFARAEKRQVLGMHGGIGAFTPAAADPRLAATLARSGLPDNGFRFTPSESRRVASRAVTVAVRARTSRTAQAADTRPTAQPASVSLAPIAYNLGVAVGWKRFAVSGDVTRVDLVTQPGSTERADVGISYTGKRASGRVRATGERPLIAPGGANATVTGDAPSYSVDVGGAYSLTRNLDVTAGVRYKSERERLPQLNEDRRESQAVYVGTAFRF